MSAPRHRSFFQIATAYPPPDEDERTQRQKRGDYPPALPEALRESWDRGLSAFDTEAATVAQARGARGRLGHLIVRYDVPEGAGITWQQTGRNPHHHSLFGDPEELRRYLTGQVLDVEQGSGAAEQRSNGASHDHDLPPVGCRHAVLLRAV